jgi:hypothetical protein
MAVLFKIHVSRDVAPFRVVNSYQGFDRILLPLKRGNCVSFDRASTFQKRIIYNYQVYGR